MLTRGVGILALACVTIIPNALSYSKYGRSCQDINCRSDERCIIAEDKCTLYQTENCGKYPTCVKTGRGEVSCVSTICNLNEYCKTENGAPKCVSKSSSAEYESAGVSIVNGQKIHDGNTNNNYNPFANANAPPAPPDLPFGSSGDQHRIRTGTNLGYPPDPPRSSSNNNNYNGYPAYPPHNSGYPPDPSYGGNSYGNPPYSTNNRMPVPGNPSGYPTGYQNPAYPQQSYGGVQYPNNQQPNQKGYNPNSIYQRNYNYNSAFTISPSILSVVLSSCLILFITFKS